MAVIYRVRTGGQIQFGVRVLPDQMSEVRARMFPNSVRYTNEKQTSHGLATVETEEMLLE